MPNDGLPPLMQNPPAEVRTDDRLREVESAIFRLDGRIDDEHHIAQHRIGELETRQIDLEGKKFGQLRADVATVLDAVTESKRYVEARLNRTDRMLEMLLRDRHLPVPA